MKAKAIKCNTRLPTQENLPNSDARYHLLAELSPDIIAIFREERFIYINRAGAAALGAESSENLIGKLLYELFSPAETDFFLEQIRRALDEEKIQKFQNILQSGEKKLWFDGSISPMSQDSVVWTAHDITKYKYLDEYQSILNSQIESQRERLKNIVASVPGVIWESWGKPDAAAQRINFVSAYVETMLGYSVEEWLTTPNFWLSIVHSEDRESAVLTASETFASRKAGTNRFRWIAKDGGVIWVEVHSITICDGDGKAIGMRGVATDIGARKQTEELHLRRERQMSLRADVNVAFAFDGSLQEILQQCTEALVQNLDAAFARIWMLNTDENMLELRASAGLYTHLNGAYARIHMGKLKIGMIARERKPYLTNDLRNDPFISDRELAEREGIVAFAGYPLIFENRLIGVLAMFACASLSEDTLEELSIFADKITQGIEQKRVEKALAQSEIQLRQSKRLESVGRWTGDIARDFNNMLTVINGYSELSLRRLKKNAPVRSNIEEIKRAGERAAILTYQLLTFSHQQVFKPELIDLNKVIDGMNNMLRRPLNENIKLIANLDSKLGLVKADAGQLSHLIMNLLTNARDAMPDGGTLKIETKNFIVDKNFSESARQHFPVKVGAYIKLTVSDTGIGMDEETQQHVFEPFYSNKNIGSGIGLGLVMVYNIVKQSGGYIFVESEIGKGTTFKIYLPQTDK